VRVGSLVKAGARATLDNHPMAAEETEHGPQTLLFTDD
jgi:hypothetical protein